MDIKVQGRHLDLGDKHDLFGLSDKLTSTSFVGLDRLSYLVSISPFVFHLMQLRRSSCFSTPSQNIMSSVFLKK
jgi:hypothetical protein